MEHIKVNCWLEDGSEELVNELKLYGFNIDSKRGNNDELAYVGSNSFI